MRFCTLPPIVLPPIAVRTDFTHKLMDALGSSVPESKVRLRGSLATGTADEYSDIDVAWEIPDHYFEDIANILAQTLRSVGRTESLRIDPEFRNGREYRLIFIRFEELPLFWRVDLEIFAMLARLRVPEPDRLASLPADWSICESALANAVAAIKACCRGRTQEAQQLIERGLARLGHDIEHFDLATAALMLADSAANREPRTAGRATRVRELIMRGSA